MNRDSGLGSFLAGVVIGGLIGAAIGLLLAPQSGDELREQVGEFVDGKKAEWDEAVNEGRVKIGDRITIGETVLEVRGG